MAVDKKVAAWGGVLFCAFMIAVLVILYYPHDSSQIENNVVDAWTPSVKIKAWDDTDLAKNDESSSDIAKFAKIIQDSAAFLAVLACLCIAIGLACLKFACCCFL